MSDRRDPGPARPRALRAFRPLRPAGPLRALRALGALAALAAAGCDVLTPGLPPPAAGTPVPCTPDAAVAAAAIAVVAGACNPGCVRVPAGTRVELFNQDPYTHYFTSQGGEPFELMMPAGTAASTQPLPAGTVVLTDVYEPAATATVLVE